MESTAPAIFQRGHKPLFNMAARWTAVRSVLKVTAKEASVFFHKVGLA